MEIDKLKSIVKDLVNLRMEGRMDFSDDVLLEQAIKIYLTDKISENKNNQVKNNFDRPTDKQIFFLKRNKVDTTNLSRQEATQIIKEIKER